MHSSAPPRGLAGSRSHHQAAIALPGMDGGKRKGRSGAGRKLGSLNSALPSRYRVSHQLPHIDGDTIDECLTRPHDNMLFGRGL